MLNGSAPVALVLDLLGAFCSGTSLVDFVEKEEGGRGCWKRYLSSAVFISPCVSS